MVRKRACGMCVRLKETLNVFAALRFRRSVVLVRLRLHRSACVTYAGGHVRWCTRHSDRPVALFTLVSGRWSSIVYTPLLIHRCVIHLRNGACRVTRASSVGFRACNASDRTVRRVSTIVAVAVVASYVLSIIRRGRAALTCASVRPRYVRVCVRACVYTCVCVRCVASVVVAHVCLVVGYANLTSLCAFVVRVCRVWPLPWLGKWDDPVVTRSEDHRGGAATGNQPRIDPVSRRLFSFSRLSFVGTTQRQPFRNCYCQLSSRIVYYLRRIY